ncbi:glycosyltransferase family 2 protein [Patescibacteria group bacterium]|nr:glycosyltransferase family 2 protein [Patescibacteria group bacterium]MBU1705560.1 glycosyltransferase family 2 protein [Patescibacteria group bacterium]
MGDQPRVSAIVPAYNEEKTIAGVIETLKMSPLIDEIIVVSDGSTDGTHEIALKAGVKALELPTKKGKGAAMLHGLAHTKANIVMFFDADLKGLRVDHIQRLVMPVLSGSRVMTAGIRDRGLLMSSLSKRFLPLIGGERAMARRVIEGMKPEFVQGFMIESAMNYHCRINGWSYGGVFLPGLHIIHKYEKVGYQKGLIEYLKMTREIIKAMVWVRVAHLLKKFP